MAELVNGRYQPRVDLTPMVDLAFLLITFFMLTMQLNKFNAMDVVLPDKTVPTDVTDFSDERTITILLGAEHKLVWYWGILNKPIQAPAITDFRANGVRNVLIDNIKKLKARVGEKSLMVIIKPGSRSTYGDLVNVLDEMKINAIKQYMLGEPDQQEVLLLDAKGL